MQRNQSSITAENNAVLRTHETMRPEKERICHDPYAVYFLPDRLLSAKDRDDQIRRLISDWEKRFPGVGNAILARTRFIDDCLEQALDAGMRQLVILGAGFDTRALRFEALKEEVTVFELDHPATQKVKLQRINKYVNAELPHVRHLAFNLNQEGLDRQLYAHGYDRNLLSLFIWEGVTYYLPAPAVDRTLSFMADTSAPQSTVVFDYFPPSVADGTTRLAEARALRKGLKHLGEEIVFGIAPQHLNAFMQARGFNLVQNLSGSDLKRAYFKGENKNRKVSQMFGLAQARVF